MKIAVRIPVPLFLVAGIISALLAQAPDSDLPFRHGDRSGTAAIWRVGMGAWGDRTTG
jgi:hypothetical protein